MFLKLIIFSFLLNQSAYCLQINHLWSTNVIEKREFGSRSHELASPLILNNDIFQGSSSGKFYIVNKQTGSIKRNIDKIGPIYSKPLINRGNLYFGNNNGSVKAYSYRTGRLLWEQEVGFPVDSTPCISKGIMSILSSSDVLLGLDVETGKVLWTVKKDFPIKKPVVMGSSSPLCVDNTIYTGFSDGSFLGVNIYDGAVVFEKKLSSKGKFLDVDASPYVDDKIIIVPSYDGFLYCIDKNTGKTLWTVSDGSAKSALVSKQEGIVYYSSNDAYLYAINIKDGTIRWSTKLSKGIPTSPVLMGNYIVVGSSERGIMFFDKNNGKYVAEFNSGRGVLSNPVVEQNKVYFFSNYAVLYALAVKF